MKKVYGIFLVLAALLIVFISYKNTNNLYKETKTSNSQITKNTEANKELYNIEKDFKIKDITIFDTTYEELIDIMGEPKNIRNIEDEITIKNYGYFSVVSYEGAEFTINWNKGFDDFKNGIVIEIDIVSPNVSTIKGITINDTKDKVKDIYSIDQVYPLKVDIEGPLHPFVIKGFKRDEQEINISEYDEYSYIQSKEKPIALIFLFKENIVKRIIVRNLNVG